MERFNTGGDEYVLVFCKGRHELRLILDDETGEYEVFAFGHYSFCQEEMAKIKKANVDYDYNL